MFVFWGDGSSEAKDLVNSIIVRSTENFNWTFIFILSVVFYIYWSELNKKNFKVIYAGLALYGVHWFYEIMNAVICHCTGYALWHVSPESTSWIILVGVCWELSLMFSIAGFTADLLPEDKHKKILGIPNRIFFAIGSALGFSLFEIFLASTPAFIWVYKWWGFLPVFVTTYIPFFLASNYVPYLSKKGQTLFLGIVWGLVALCLITLIPLGII